MLSDICGSICRVGDDDPRNGPASLQRFDGEDFTAGDRNRAQQQQCADWWIAQQEQHAAQREVDRATERRNQELVGAEQVVHAPTYAANPRVVLVEGMF